MRARVWLYGTVLLSAGSFAAAVLLAPPAGSDPDQMLTWLLFVGSSVHVAATAWFYFVPQVRAYALAHPGRYVVTPMALVTGTGLLAVVLPSDRFRWLLLGFFAWQFFHYQKQNVGMAALAGVSQGVGSVSTAERRAIVATGTAGIVGLVVHPELLQVAVDPHVRWLFPAAGGAFASAAAFGVWALARRPRARRPPGYDAVYLLSLLFFLPVFAFANPYAAVAGLTLAHGFQYLLLVGLVAGARAPAGGGLGLAVLLNVGLLGGLALNAASHLHDAGPAGRALFGAYLGVSMAHFVVDAGLWRLRAQFPRQFLGERVPYLVRPGQPPLSRPRTSPQR